MDWTTQDEPRIKFNGKRIKLTIQQVTNSDGHSFIMEVAKVKNAVAVLPVVEDKVLLVKQVRPATGNMHPMYEIPAGLIEAGEDTEEAANRELVEETGYFSKNLIHLGNFYTSPGLTNERVTIFIAKNLEFRGISNRDESESDMAVEWISEQQLLEIDHLIFDMKTAYAIAAYNSLYKKCF